MTRRKDEKTSIKLGNFIKANREKKYPGWGGKSSAAKAFGVNPNVWSTWELGRATPDDVNQRKLAKFFGVSLAVLRGDHSPEPPPEPPPPLDPMAEAIEAWKGRALFAEQRLAETEAELALIREELAEVRERAAAQGVDLEGTKKNQESRTPHSYAKDA